MRNRLTTTALLLMIASLPLLAQQDAPVNPEGTVVATESLQQQRQMPKS